MIDDVLEQTTAIFAFEGFVISQGLIHHGADRKDIGSPVHAMAFTPRLLGTHVGGRTDVGAATFLFDIAQGQTEIGDVRAIVLVEQNVSRLDVPVYDPARVRIGECVTDATKHFGELLV